MRRALILAALLAAAVAAAPAQAGRTDPSAPPPIPIIGIGEQNQTMFANPNFGKLDVKHVRIIAAWDALRHRWSRAELDSYMTAAHQLGVRVLLGFGHARSPKRSVRRHVPSVKVFVKEFLRFKRRYPWVKDWLTWNEANHCGEPTCHKAPLVARFYNNMRHRCFGCNVVGADVLDTPAMVPWIKVFKRNARKDKMIWGLHNYLDANRMRTSGTRELLRATRYGKVWFTETGGVVKRTNRGRITFPESRRHAAKATKQVFRLARLSPRVRRIYFYQWMPSTMKHSSWDSALVDKHGRPRPAFNVLAGYVRKFARIAARRKQAAEREQDAPPAVITTQR